MIIMWHIDLVYNLIVGAFYEYFFADLQIYKIMPQITLCNEQNMIRKPLNERNTTNVNSIYLLNEKYIGIVR